MFKTIKYFVFDLLIAFILFILLYKYVIFLGVVPSDSMYPTLNVGDKILIEKLSVNILGYTSIKYNDIIVFKQDDKYIVKRVIGLSGDTIELKEGKVYRNSELLIEDYVNNYKVSSNLSVLVEKDTLFLLGDNRINSYDSSEWLNPLLDFDSVVGKVLFKE